MIRPTRAEFAKARADLQKFLATHPTHELAPILAVLLRATAPFTKDEAVPVMVLHANEAGGWSAREEEDVQHAQNALKSETSTGSWDHSIRAQWATIKHFFGCVE